MNILSKLFRKNKPHKIVKPYQCGFLSVGDGHQIYYELSGNKHGIPVVILHGGPGGNLSDSKKAYFNPRKYHIIQYDQRGCGKSLPKADITNNTTEFLLQDIEKLRVFLSIDKWVVSGSSWGSALGLLYAIRFKDKVSAIIINSVFLATKNELEEPYLKTGIPARVYPDNYEKFIKTFKIEDINLHACLSEIENCQDKEEKEELIRKLMIWELSLCVMNPNLEKIKEYVYSEDFSLDYSTVERHYFSNNLFFNGENMIKELNILSNIPTYIVQGRYDVLCPPENAYKLAKAIKTSKIYFTCDGHSIQSNNGKCKIVEYANEILENLK